MVGEHARGHLPVILLTLFLDLVGFSIIFPLFADLMHFYGNQDDPVYSALTTAILTVVPGASEGQQAAAMGGLLMAVYGILQFFATPLWGTLSDRHGRRPVLLITVTGNLVGYGLWIVADAFWLLLLARAVNGIMGGNLSVLTAAAADGSQPEQRTRVMGAVGAAFGLGFIAGPGLGGLSMSFLPSLDGVLPGFHPFTVPALIAAGLTMVNLAWIARSLPETLPSAERGLRQPIGGPWTILARPVHGRLDLHHAYGLFMAIFSGMEAALVFLVKDALGYGPGATGLLFVQVGVISALVQGGLVRRLADRVSPGRLARTGIIIHALGMGVLGLVAWWPRTDVAHGGLVLLAVGIGLCLPSMSAWISALSAKERQGQAMGQMRALGALARVVGPLVGAGLYFAFSPGAPFLIGALSLIVPLTLLVRVPDVATARG